MIYISQFVDTLVCFSVCLLFELPIKRLFAPTSQSKMTKNFRDSESWGKSNGNKWSHVWKLLLKKGVKSPHKKSLFLGEFCKDQEVLQQGSGDYIYIYIYIYIYTTRIRRLYNKDQELLFSDTIIEPLQKTFAFKGGKIIARKKVCYSANFASLAGFFWYQCYYIRIDWEMLCLLYAGFFLLQIKIWFMSWVTCHNFF